MNVRTFFRLFLLCLATHVFAQTAAELSTEAQRAYVAGDLEVAKEKFKLALELQPGNVTARNYLRMIQVRQAQSGAGGELEKKVRGVKIESVKFQSATFREALDFLKQQAAKQSVPVSFVAELPPEMVAKPVTLNLTNVPLLEALRYLCESVGAHYTIEKYAVVIRPAEKPMIAPSPAQ